MFLRLFHFRLSCSCPMWCISSDKVKAVSDRAFVWSYTQMSIINFLNHHNGLTNFFCYSGPFIGKIITVRSLNHAWHNKAWYEGKIFQNYTRESFEAYVLASVGIVHANGEPVPAAICDLVKTELSYRPSSTTNVVDHLHTGIRSPFGNWRRLSTSEQARLFDTYVEDELDDLRVQSLPAASLPSVTSSIAS